ncbi:MAG TPA: HAMP domain-containing protein, partial [candidate division WOR-3 bacterium]|nr:HAMP domain-containing protein [candidate division WOR-3 bacterium]
VFIAVKKENVRISRIDLVLPEFFREEYGLEVYIPPYIYYREKEALKVKRLRKIPDAPGFRFPVVFSSDVYSVSDNRYYEGSVFFLRGTLGALISGIIKGKNTISNSVFLSFLFFAIILSFLNLIAMFGGYLIVRDISKGMSRLSFAINAVKRGDLTVRLNPNRVDELGEMMRNFDLMVERMRLLLEKEKEIDIMEQEIKIARKIQLRLMPPEKVEIPGIEHSALTIAARGVGGDFYDIIKGEDWVVVMADVSGKGLHSSLFGAMLKGILTALIKMGLSLKHAVEMSNKLLYHHLYPTHFITLAAIRIKEDEIEVVRAGHQPVLVYKPFSESELERMLVLKPEGIGLGMVEDLSPYIESEKIKIEKGDLFVLFTDGLSELPSKDKRELFGLDRIVSIIKKYYNRPSSEILSRIIKMAESFSGEELPPDDIALFIGKVK